MFAFSFEEYQSIRKSSAYVGTYAQEDMYTYNICHRATAS